MTFDVLSDLHLDFWKTTIATKYKNDEIAWWNSFEPRSDILICAGDIGHDDAQNIAFFKKLKAEVYREIICVLGNHDYYVVPKTKQLRSQERAANLRRDLREIGVHVLDGNVVEIDGIRFGGCDSWYDGTYGPMDPHNTINQMWRNMINDANYINDIVFFDDLWKIEEPKLQKVFQECDVMVTHVCPSIQEEAFPDIWKRNQGNRFFSFAGEHFLEGTTAHVWIYGHTHNFHQFEHAGVRVIANPLGYPGERGKPEDGYDVAKIVKVEVLK